MDAILFGTILITFNKTNSSFTWKKKTQPYEGGTISPILQIRKPEHRETDLLKAPPLVSGRDGIWAQSIHLWEFTSLTITLNCLSSLV